MIDSGVDVADVLLLANDPQTVAPLDAPLEVVAETKIAAPVEAPVTLVEVPVAAEVSAEQP